MKTGVVIATQPRRPDPVATTYIVATIMLVALYPACRWYRTVKTAYPTSVLKYF